jgi:MoaA/NifB/PqqE/SkfB family radical SAM enzyme
MCNLSITLGCMLRCNVCHHWQCDEKDTVKPTLKQWKDFLISLKGNVAGDFTVVFGGGEPLLFPEMLIELISFCSGLGFRTSLATSGHTITKEYARDLSRSGLGDIGLTIFSLNHKTHDAVRGVPGALQRALNALEHLSPFSAKLKMGINTIIMKPSLHELLALTDRFDQDKRFTGVYYQAITRPFHTPFVEDWHKNPQYQMLWPDDLSELDAVLDALIAKKKSGRRIANPVSQFELFKTYFKNPSGFVKPYKCHLVDGKFFAINSDGSVCLCPYFQPLGKIKEADFNHLWNSERSRQIKEQITQCKTNCHHLINCWYEEA